MFYVLTNGNEFYIFFCLIFIIKLTHNNFFKEEDKKAFKLCAKPKLSITRLYSFITPKKKNKTKTSYDFAILVVMM